MKSLSQGRMQPSQTVRAIVQAVSRRPLTAKDRIRARVSPCGSRKVKIRT
jgi:hypothetical protein